MRLFGIILFFLTLCLPTLEALTGWLDDFEIDENRTRAVWPHSNPVDDPVGYFAAAEAWFDDHFGGRDFLIRLKTQIDYSVFGTSTRVHVGRDGWLFYRSVLDVEKPAMERRLSADGDAVAGGIEQLARGLERRNVHLILMPVFLGDVYYPDKLPSSIPNIPQPSRFSRAVERWRQLPELTVFDSAQILRDVQRLRPTFYKTDFHWNEPAAFEVARQLVNSIAEREGRKQGAWDHALNIESRFFIGKESAFLPLFVQPSEDGLFVRKTWSNATLHLDWHQGIYEWVATQMDPNQEALPALCVVGDSFFDGMYESGIMSYFQKTYRIRWQSETTLYSALEQMPRDCRYLLVEFIEVQFSAISSFVDASKHLKPAIEQDSSQSVSHNEGHEAHR